MNSMIIKSIDIELDRWKIYKPSSVGEYITFDFSYLPSEWFKKTHKQIIIDCLTINKPTIESIKSI